MIPKWTAVRTHIEYDEPPARQLLWASVIWGIVGVIVALQLGIWEANLEPRG